MYISFRSYFCCHLCCRFDVQCSVHLDQAQGWAQRKNAKSHCLDRLLTDGCRPLWTPKKSKPWWGKTDSWGVFKRGLLQQHLQSFWTQTMDMCPLNACFLQTVSVPLRGFLLLPALPILPAFCKSKEFRRSWVCCSLKRKSKQLIKRGKIYLYLSKEQLVKVGFVVSLKTSFWCPGSHRAGSSANNDSTVALPPWLHIPTKEALTAFGTKNFKKIIELVGQKKAQLCVRCFFRIAFFPYKY